MEDIIQKSSKELEKEYKTDLEEGLTNKQVEENRLKYGVNKLPVIKPKPWYILFLKTLIEPVQIILICAAIISVIAPLISTGWKIQSDTFLDFSVILLIVVIDAILETVQAIKAQKSVNALKSISEPKAVVVRNGQQQEIKASDVVVGDIVILEAGKYIPAEIRIIEQSDLLIDESILTGESLLVKKTEKSLAKKTTILAEMTNIGFMSTMIKNGRAVGLVVKVGETTEIGKITASISSSEEVSTPLEKKLTKFSYWIAGLAFFIGGIIFAALFLTGDRSAWSNYLMVSITLAIGVIPESLSAVVSITLSRSTKTMSKQNVIVKKLASVETLGSVNIICTDKTGTLTQNRMTVTKIISNNKVLTSEEYVKQNPNKKTKKDQSLDVFAKALVLCNDSVTEGKERIGDPTELALVDFAELLKYDEQDSRDKWERIEEIPFDSERKMMSTVNEIDGVNTVFTKGAIDELLKVCSHIIYDGKRIELTEEYKTELLNISHSLSDQALRVLAFAYSENYNPKKNKSDIEKNLTFIGGVGMIDPVRKSAVVAIKEAKAAGIDVVMITGDHPTTALAIAKDLDLAYSEYEVMSSDRLNEMDDHQLDRIIKNIKVYARVNPEHKVRIVAALQRNGNITSMTGDGVNDAPSLVKADIGVAMGITGTDVAKEAADVILTDDNFKTIMNGVFEGRNVYQKIRRAIAFVIGVNMANVLSIFILSLINHISPVEATDILWMNLVIESVLAITIGMGQNDKSLMMLKPIKGPNSLFKGLWEVTIKILILTSATTVGSFYIGMLFLPQAELDAIINKHNLDPSTSWLEVIRNTSIDMEEKLELEKWGRTACFISITCAPSLFVNIIKLSNWKSSKKINFIINKPLLLASLSSVVLNCAVVFIPMLNNNVLDLVPTTEYNSKNWYFVPSILLLSVAPTLMMLIINGIQFVSYHYKPKPWLRNRMISDQFKKRSSKRK